LPRRSTPAVAVSRAYQRPHHQRPRHPLPRRPQPRRRFRPRRPPLPPNPFKRLPTRSPTNRPPNPPRPPSSKRRNPITEPPGTTTIITAIGADNVITPILATTWAPRGTAIANLRRWRASIPRIE